MSTVSALGYMEIGASDLGAWQHYAETVVGASCEKDGDALVIRIDDDCWRLRITPTGEDDVTCIGFKVGSEADLSAIRSRLESAGTVTTDGSAEENTARGVSSLVVCSDPFGLRVELYVGDRATTPYASPFEHPGFVTGAMGLGHMVLYVADQDAAESFYMDGLGFLLSDHILVGPEDQQLQLTFLHCNPRHHTLALAPVPLPRRLNHIMLQVPEMDEVGLCLDRARNAEVKISSGLGRHPNDQMFSFYMKTPSGFDIEYGAGGIEIDDATWQTAVYYQTSTWGHQPE